MNAYPDHAAFEQAILPVVRRNHNWTLRRDADFLNFLCPSGGDLSELFPEEHSNDDHGEPHPFVAGSEAWMKGRLKSAFQDMTAKYDLARFEADLAKSEMKVLQAIERKTFNFRKVFEKIPGSVFIKGQRGDDGELAMDDYGLPILPPTGIRDRSNVSHAVSGLVSKGVITRIEADTHPTYGTTNIYAALPAETIRDTLLRHLQASPSRAETYKLDREVHGRMVRKLAGMIRQAATTIIG